MYKKFGLFMCLLLSLSIMLSASADGQTLVYEFGDAPTDDFGQDIAFYRGKVYIKAIGGLYRCDLSGEGMELVCRTSRTIPHKKGEERFFDRLIVEDDVLYAYDSYGCVLSAINPVQGSLGEGERFFPDYSGFDVSGDRPMFHRRVFMQGGKLFVLIADGEDYVQENQYRLLSFDLVTGERQEIAAEGIADAAPYQEGYILLVVYEEDQDAPALFSDNPGLLYRYGLRDGTMTLMGELPVPYMQHVQMIYDETDGSIVYAAPNHIIKRDADGTEKAMAYNPFPSGFYSAGNAMVLADRETLITNAVFTLGIIPLNEAQDDRPVITVYGTIETDTRHMKAAAGMKGAEVKVASTEYGAQYLNEALIVGTENIDVFILDSAYFDVERMMDKGWLMDLSDQQQLREYWEKAYPIFSDAGKIGERIYALPAQAMMYAWFINDHEANEHDLEFQGSFESLCGLVGQAQEMDEVIPYPLYRGDNYREDMFITAQMLYVDALSAREEKISYDTELFRRLMAAAGNVQAKKPDPLYAASGKKQLFMSDAMPYSLTGRTFDEYGESGFKPVSVKIEENQADRYPVSVRMIGIHSGSKNAQQAARYVKAYLDAAALDEQMMLSPDINDPIEHPDYQVNLEQQREHLAALEKAALQAEGAEKTQMELQIQELRSIIASENHRWLVSPEVISEYRLMMEHASVMGFGSRKMVYNENIQSIFRRLMAGQIDVERFITEAEGVLRLMMLEDQ